MQCPTNASARPSILLTNTSVPTTAWTSDTTYSGYTKRADISVTGATASMSGSVVFGNTEASSGNYAPFCVTGTNKVSIYSRITPSSAITIPTIEVDNMMTYTTLDNAPTSGSTLPVTSGGVYDALKTVEITGLTFTGVTGNVKAYRSGNIVQICLAGADITASNETYIVSGLPKAKYNSAMYLVDWWNGTHAGLLSMMTGGTQLRRYGSGTVSNVWITFTYMVDV